jgi:hypothetical protein
MAMAFAVGLTRKAWHFRQKLQGRPISDTCLRHLLPPAIWKSLEAESPGEHRSWCWVELHQQELMDNWELGRQHQEPQRIEPLKWTGGINALGRGLRKGDRSSRIRFPGADRRVFSRCVLPPLRHPAEVKREIKQAAEITGIAFLGNTIFNK